MINQQCGNCRNAFAALRTIEKELHEEKEHNAELRKLAEAETEYDALEEACKRVMEERDEALAKLANLHFMHDGRLLDLKAVTAERDQFERERGEYRNSFHDKVIELDAVTAERDELKSQYYDFQRITTINALAEVEKAEARAAKYREALEKIYTYRSDDPDWNMVMAIAGDQVEPMDIALSDTEETSGED